MEKDFLLYLIYITLIDIRTRSYENNDTVSFGLCNLLHNVPLTLISEKTGEQAYRNFLEKIEDMKLESWLNSRKTEFYERFPEYKNQL